MVVSRVEVKLLPKRLRFQLSGDKTGPGLKLEHFIYRT